MRLLPQHSLQLSTCGIFWVGQPEVKIPAGDQTKRELGPRSPTYDVNVQPWLGSRAWEEGTALIPASLDYLIPLVNLAPGLFLRSLKVEPNDSRWIKCCKQSRTAFFFWLSENVEKPCLGEQSTTTVKKEGRMVAERETCSFIVSAPEGPAGAGVCSQPSLLRVWMGKKNI